MMLLNHERTERVRQKIQWQGAETFNRGSRFAQTSDRDCRHCRHAQIQDRAAVVCLIASIPTQKRAVCAGYSYGEIRLYQEPGGQT